MATKFRKTNPDFYNGYFAARVIVNRAAFHGAPQTLKEGVLHHAEHIVASPITPAPPPKPVRGASSSKLTRNVLPRVEPIYVPPNPNIPSGGGASGWSSFLQIILFVIGIIVVPAIGAFTLWFTLRTIINIITTVFRATR
jgi:hypothetical protein